MNNHEIMIIYTLPTTKRVVVDSLVVLLSHCILVWLFHIVSLINSLIVGGIPGVSIGGSWYTLWALSCSSWLINWRGKVLTSLARSINQKGVWLLSSAVQFISTVDSFGANMWHWPWFVNKHWIDHEGTISNLKVKINIEDTQSQKVNTDTMNSQGEK